MSDICTNALQGQFGGNDSINNSSKNIIVLLTNIADAYDTLVLYTCFSEYPGISICAHMAGVSTGQLPEGGLLNHPYGMCMRESTQTHIQRIAARDKMQVCRTDASSRIQSKR